MQINGNAIWLIECPVCVCDRLFEFAEWFSSISSIITVIVIVIAIANAIAIVHRNV